MVPITITKYQYIGNWYIPIYMNCNFYAIEFCARFELIFNVKYYLLREAMTLFSFNFNQKLLPS